ncbi:SRPBCC domain-containing protein [Paenibacillus sp. P25]|nr:SRPBCC domain-containing protein [Paenibacillus sp. P25]
METSQPTKVTVQAVIQAPVEKVWRYWTEPDHITKWNQASEDWHAPRAENDLRVGGKFLTRMEAKRSTRKAPIPSSSSKQAGKRSWTISKPIPNKTNHREEDAGEDARRLSF